MRLAQSHTGRDSWARMGRQVLGFSPNIRWGLMQNGSGPGELWQSRGGRLAVLEKVRAPRQPGAGRKCQGGSWGL